MVDKTPHEAMAGSASGLTGYEIMLLARGSPPTVNSIAAGGFFGPNNDQAARGDHTHTIADGVRPGFMSTGDRAKLDALATNRQIPAGGGAGQILQKASGTDYHIAWADAPVGGGGGGGWVQQNTQAALQAANPTMALGAIGWETDTGRWKIGDGVTAWNTLPYTDFKRTPAAITNPGTTASFRFRSDATQIITFTTPPAGTVTIQAPTSAPPASHEAVMYFRIQNQSAATVTIAAAGFQLDGDYLISTILSGTTQEYTIWVLAGVWYISGGQDLEDGSVGNAQLADIASGRIKGRYTAGTGDVEDLVPNQVRWLIDNAQPNVIAVAANTTLTKAAHQGRYLVCSTAVNLTVDASTDFDQHYDTVIRAEGGAVTVVATATVNAASGLVIPQHATGVLRRMTATDVYSLEIASHPKVTGADSIAATTSAGTTTLRLVGDEAPGATQYYGTAAGVRGFHDLPAGGGATNLDALTDVVISSPVADQVIAYNGTNFVNSTIAAPSGAGTVVANIAALKAVASPTDGQFVFVRGYSTATDGGGGLFQWNSTYTDYKTVSGVTIAAGGSGYSAGQLVWVNTGTATDTNDKAYIRVTTVSGGVATGVSIVLGGQYSSDPTTTASATATGGAASGTGLTLNLTLSSWEDGGTVFIKTGGGTGRWVRRYEGLANILWFGAVADNSANCSPAVQAAVNTGLPIYFPGGTYKLFSTITWFSPRSIKLYGEGIYGWGTTTISDGRGAGVEEPMFHKFGRYMKADGTYVFDAGFEIGGNNLGGIGGAVVLSKIRFASSQSIYGSCFEVTLSNNIDVSFCSFDGTYRGLTLGQSTFEARVDNCRFSSAFKDSFAWTGSTGGTSNKIIARRAWGLYCSGHKVVTACSFVGYGTGIYMTSIENNIFGARMETNYYAIIMGSTDYWLGGPTASISSRSTISGISMEANTYGLLIQDMKNCTINGIGIQGSPASGSRPDGEYGVYIEKQYGTNIVHSIEANGTFKVAFLNLSGQPIWNNASSATARYGAANTPFLYKSGNRPWFHAIRTVNPEGSYTSFSDLRQHGGITKLDVRGTSVQARNVSDVATIAQGATTVAVAFPGEITTGAAGFNTLTANTDAGSTLAANTYYYATTVLNWNGEVGVNYSNSNSANYKTLTIASGQKADLVFYGGFSSGLVRRIYRGTEIGEFSGYFQIAINTNFSDTGQAFTGYAWPPPDGSVPTLAEEDANYSIVATAQNWNSGAVWITNRATSGFTINVANAAPAGGGIVSWMLFR